DELVRDLLGRLPLREKLEDLQLPLREPRAFGGRLRALRADGHRDPEQSDDGATLAQRGCADLARDGYSTRLADVERQLGRIPGADDPAEDRKSTRLNSSHRTTSYAVSCLQKKRGSRAESERERGLRRHLYGSAAAPDRRDRLRICRRLSAYCPEWNAGPRLRDQGTNGRPG